MPARTSSLPTGAPASKVLARPDQGLASLRDGATVLVGGFGDSGIPFALLHGVRDAGVRDLTIVSINAGSGARGIAALIDAGLVGRMICSFPRTAGSVAFERAYLARRVALELVPMGTLVERLRAGGAGIAAFYTRVAAETDLAAGKEVRTIDGRPHVLEYAIRGDLGLVRAHLADTFGNLVYRGVERNLNPVIAKAAALTIAEVAEIMPLGAIEADRVTTSGAYVDFIVQADAENGDG